jgi:hypothetical protein
VFIVYFPFKQSSAIYHNATPLYLKHLLSAQQLKNLKKTHVWKANFHRISRRFGDWQDNPHSTHLHGQPPKKTRSSKENTRGNICDSRPDSKAF